MRIFFLPVNGRHTLLYAQRLSETASTSQKYTDRIVKKVNTTWLKWEAAEKGWQKKVTEWGNSAFARIPYQEWGLKSIPPLNSRLKSLENNKEAPVDVIYPGSTVQQSKVLEALRKLSTERQAFHRTRMIWSFAGLPLTIPFGIIPVIPNLPFFYLAFRCWSHYRALAGSRHLQFLVKENLLDLTPSPTLQLAYDLKTAPDQTINEIKSIYKTVDEKEPKAREETSDKQKEANVQTILSERIKLHSIDASKPPDQPRAETDLLLSKGSGKLISNAFGVPELEVEIERALDQVSKAKDEAQN